MMVVDCPIHRDISQNWSNVTTLCLNITCSSYVHFLSYFKMIIFKHYKINKRNVYFTYRLIKLHFFRKKKQVYYKYIFLKFYFENETLTISVILKKIYELEYMTWKRYIIKFFSLNEINDSFHQKNKCEIFFQILLSN